MSLVDRGNYTCRPASGGEASISLHVLEGDHQDGDEDDCNHDEYDNKFGERLKTRKQYL